MELVLVIGVAVLVAVTAIRDAWLVGRNDATWDLRWRALDPDDQARLAVAGLSRASTAAVVDPEERQLAEGFGRRERQRRAYLDLVLVAALALVAGLALAGVVAPSTFGLILGVYAGLRLAVESLRDRQIKGRVRRETERDAKVPA